MSDLNLFSKYHSKEDITKYFGDLSQAFGIKSFTLNEGNAKGTDAFDVKTGSGFEFTVIPDRAMDISWMSYKGLPISYITKSGVTNPLMYNAGGYEWLRSFFGGALTTCGLTHVGDPVKDGIWDVGLHGRISNNRAFEVCHSSKWENDDLIFNIEGKVREAVLYEENLLLHRTISCKAGENKLTITDEIQNEGFAQTPFMILYHINIGYPLVSPNSKIYFNSSKSISATKKYDSDIASCKQMTEPSDTAKTEVFTHDLEADDEGNCTAAIINHDLKFGFYIKYAKKNLRGFTQWKNMSKQDYVIGLEPCNYDRMDREEIINSGSLKFINGGESLTNHKEMGILDGTEDIENFMSKNNFDK